MQSLQTGTGLPGGYTAKSQCLSARNYSHHSRRHASNTVIDTPTQHPLGGGQMASRQEGGLGLALGFGPRSAQARSDIARIDPGPASERLSRPLAGRVALERECRPVPARTTRSGRCFRAGRGVGYLRSSLSVVSRTRPSRSVNLTRTTSPSRCFFACQNAPRSRRDEPGMLRRAIRRAMRRESPARGRWRGQASALSQPP